MDYPTGTPTSHKFATDRQALAEDAFHPELGSLPNPPERDSIPRDAVTKTGTTTVGLKTGDGVVLATDRRASAGRMVSSKTVQKVEEVHPTGALTIAGMVSAAQSLIQTLRAEVSLYEVRRGEEMTMQALSTFTGNILRSGAFLIVQPVLGGVDEDGAHVYSIDPLGGTMEEDYTVSGSGSPFALGVLEQEYDDDIATDEARTVAARAIESASERDTASGNGIVMATVTEDGVEIETHSDLEDLV